MIRTDKRMRLCTTLLVCNLVFIWGNSLLPGEVSGAISGFVKDVLEGILPIEDNGDSEGIGLRKLAHFTEFAALGALLSWRSGMLGKKNTLPLVSGVTAACIDETIQLFVPDRGPGVKDVLIDSSGVITGMLLLHLGHTYFSKKTKE